MVISAVASGITNSLLQAGGWASQSPRILQDQRPTFEEIESEVCVACPICSAAPAPLEGIRGAVEAELRRADWAPEVCLVVR